MNICEEFTLQKNGHVWSMNCLRRVPLYVKPDDYVLAYDCIPMYYYYDGYKTIHAQFLDLVVRRCGFQTGVV